MAVGVMAMIVTLAVMDGFEEDLKQKLLGNMAPITLSGRALEENQVLEIGKSLEVMPQIQGMSPYVRTQVLLASTGRPLGTTLVGVDPETVPITSRLPEQMLEGKLGALKGFFSDPGGSFPECVDKPVILLGRELIDNLGCFYGDLIRVVSPVGIETPFGIVPIQKSFCVGGIFQTGLYEYDATFAYISLENAQEFLQIGSGLTGIEIGISDIHDARRIAAGIREIVGPELKVEDWMQKNRRLLSAMRLEKITAFAVLTLIVLVAVLSILSSLSMTVMEKRKEIAILKALGATQRRIEKLFILQGVAIGLSGTILGVGSGIGLCKLLEAYPVVRLPQDVFYQLALPVKMEIIDVLSVSLATLLLSLLATLYPAKRAARLPPAEILRGDFTV